MDKIKNFLDYKIFGFRTISYIMVLIFAISIKINHFSFLDIIGGICISFLIVCIIYLLLFIIEKRKE